MIQPRFAALLAILLVALPTLATAQFEGHPFELSIQGGASQPIAEDGTSMSYTLGTGLALRTGERLRLGAEFHFVGVGVGDDSQDLLDAVGMDMSTSVLEYGAFARLHLQDALSGPYLKGSLGMRHLRASATVRSTTTSGSDTVLGYGLGFGWMLPGVSDVATFFEAEFSHAFPGETAGVQGSAVDQVGFDVLKLSIGGLFGTGF